LNGLFYLQDVFKNGGKLRAESAPAGADVGA